MLPTNEVLHKEGLLRWVAHTLGFTYATRASNCDPRVAQTCRLLACLRPADLEGAYIPTKTVGTYAPPAENK